MASNKELITKVDLALSDLAADGGLLNAEQSNTFFRTMIEQPTIIGQVRTVQMNSPSQKIDKIGFGSRILRAANQTSGSRSLAATDRVKPDLGQVELNTSEVIAEIRLPYETLEDNIERGNMTNTILALIAERATLDLEELAILGDTADADPYLALQNGYLKRMSSNVVNATGLGVTSQVFNNAIKAMPKRYRRNKNLMRFFVEMDLEQDYRQSVTSRDTGLGDAILTGNQALPVHGVPMVGNALLPNQTGIFSDPKNLLFGVQRQVRIESDKDISAREYIFVLTSRVALAIEEEPATVKIENIGA